MKNSELKSIFSKLINNQNNKNILSNKSSLNDLNSNQVFDNFISNLDNVTISNFSFKNKLVKIKTKQNGPKLFINFHLDNSDENQDYNKLIFIISLIISTISNGKILKFLPGEILFFIFTNNYKNFDFRSQIFNNKKIFGFFEKNRPDLAINIKLSTNKNTENFIFIEKNIRSLIKEITFLSNSPNNQKDILDSSYNFYYNAINFIRDTFLDSDEVIVSNNYGYFTPENNLICHTKIHTSNNVSLEKYSSKIDLCIEGAALASGIEARISNSHSNFLYHNNQELDKLYTHNINSISKDNVQTKYLSNPHPMNDLSLIIPTTTINCTTSFEGKRFLTFPQSLGMLIIDLLNSQNTIYTKIKNKSYSILNYEEYFDKVHKMSTNSKFDFTKNHE